MPGLGVLRQRPPLARRHRCDSNSGLSNSRSAALKHLPAVLRACSKTPPFNREPRSEMRSKSTGNPYPPCIRPCPGANRSTFAQGSATLTFMRQKEVVAALRRFWGEPDAPVSVHRDGGFWHGERRHFERGVEILMLGGSVWVVVDATGEVFESSASLSPERRIEDVQSILDLYLPPYPP